MAVVRIVPNLKTDAPEALSRFYREFLDLDLVMDMGWIATIAAAEVSGPVQITCASEGGSGTDLPVLSIEVDDLDASLDRAKTLGIEVEYGPVEEPWGVRRFFVRDPEGRLLNIAAHMTSDGGAA